MTSTAEAPDLLAAIVAATRRMVDVRAAQMPLDELDHRAAGVEPRPGFFKEALSRADRLNVIAECKRRSPSRGVLKGGLRCCVHRRAGTSRQAPRRFSVLTEPAFFDGHLDHLVAARR
jgi:indole-3-glycerol phosphate synthase